MLGLSSFGLFHTAISLIALVSGVALLVRDREISMRSAIGRLYVITTLATAITGFGIFRHGGFGKPHALGLITLLVLGLALIAERRAAFGRRAPYVATIGYSATVLFHLIPGITETVTRLPASAPLVSGPDAPELQAATGVLVLLFVIGAVLQARRLRAAEAQRADLALPDVRETAGQRPPRLRA